MPPSDTALELRHVRKSFGAHVALADVNLQIGSGEFFTLLGPSGCGKTTLLRLIAGLDRSDSGEIRLFGEDVAGLEANQRPINTVFQHYALFPHMTVAANVGFGLRMLGWPVDRCRSRVAEMLALVRMGDLAGRRPGMLSGGQQQRVALARALAPEPRLLLLDEPLSALDLKLRQEMRFELKQLQEKTSVTFVFVTHDQDEALAMSDRIAVLNSGEIVQVGTPAELYERPAVQFVAAFLGNSNFLKARVKPAPNGSVTVLLADGLCFPAAPGLADFAEIDVVLAVRPERIRIGHPSASEPTALVERVVYLGPTIEVHLLAGDTTIVAHVASSDAQTSIISRGKQVGFSIPPEAFRRVPK